jgi:hypothetical protein
MGVLAHTGDRNRLSLTIEIGIQGSIKWLYAISRAVFTPAIILYAQPKNTSAFLLICPFIYCKDFYNFLLKNKNPRWRVSIGRMF